MLRKAIVLAVAAASLSGITASAQTIEQLRKANAICGQTMAAYRRSSDPVGDQVLANNLLAQAANDLQSLGVPNLNMLVSALRERVAIGSDFAVSMRQGGYRRTMALSDRLDENGVRVKEAAARFSLDQCARLGGL